MDMAIIPDDCWFFFKKKGVQFMLDEILHHLQWIKMVSKDFILMLNY
jgi:hypothetical protein